METEENLEHVLAEIANAQTYSELAIYYTYILGESIGRGEQKDQSLMQIETALFARLEELGVDDDLITLLRTNIASAEVPFGEVFERKKEGTMPQPQISDRLREIIPKAIGRFTFWRW